MPDVSIVTPWSFFPDADPSGALGAGATAAGTDRALVIMYGSGNHDISAFGWSVSAFTVDGEEAVFQYKTGDSADDAPRLFGIWSEAQIAAFVGTTANLNATVIANDFWGWALYENVDQTGDFASIIKDANNNTSDVGTLDLTTTSVSGDRIVVLGGINTGDRNFTSFDTATELYDVASSPNNARFGAGEGNGGDDITTITTTQSGRPNHASIVLPATLDPAHLMMIRMMHEGH